MSTISVVRGDITQMKADAIVNAANGSLLGGGGVDGAIHRAAGPELLAACRKLNGCQTGEAKITPAFQLPAKYVIHTVGPIYSSQKKDRAAVLLSNCYRNSLNLAKQNNLHSIIFSAISTGVYGYPKKAAAEVAIKAIRSWLKQYPNYKIKISLCAYDLLNEQIYRNLL